MPHILRKEGKHRYFKGLEYWPEEGTIIIEDRIKNEFNVVTCRDFALRAKAMNEEAKRAKYPDERKELQDLVITMHEVWKECKEQGDPTDIEVMKRKMRERRKAVMITGMW